MLDWLSGLLESLRAQDARELLLVSIVLFLVMFAASLALSAWIIVQIPATYFRDDHPHALADHHPVIRWLGLLLKNLAGIVLIILGILLSLPGVPGQGALTILIGLMLVNFPGKRRLERRLVSLPSVRKAIDRLRGRFGRPPLDLDPDPDSEEVA